MAVANGANLLNIFDNLPEAICCLLRSLPSRELAKCLSVSRTWQRYAQKILDQRLRMCTNTVCTS